MGRWEWLGSGEESAVTWRGNLGGSALERLGAAAKVAHTLAHTAALDTEVIPTKDWNPDRHRTA